MAKMSQHRLACVIFAIIMGAFGIFHMFHASNLEGQVPKFIPGGVIWVYISGAVFMVAAAAILFNYKTKRACYVLGAMLIIFILLVDVPLIATAQAETRQQEHLLMMLKDIGLAMAAFLIGYNSDRPDDAVNY